MKLLHNFLRFVYGLLSGILMFASIMLLICIAFVALFNFKYDKHTLIFLSIILIGIIGYLVYNKKVVINTKRDYQSWFFFKEILKVAAVLFVFGLFITKIQLPKPLTDKKEVAVVETEDVVLYTDSSETSYEKYYQSKQTWFDFRRRKHVMKFRVDYDSVVKSKENRESLNRVDYSNKTGTRFNAKTRTIYRTYTFSWEKLYGNLVKNDKSLIDDLALEFYNYQIQKKLDRKQFAELMITAIQDIPYGLVLSDSCSIDEVKPCVGNVKFGLFAPAEYISNLHGDCDTRTVLLFTLLSRFNYDVAILNSKEYKHSMLGLNIAATGKFKAFKYKKYYFIETTARGCPIGYLSKDFLNIDNWDFVLMHNNI
ncbi:hypothetical protein [Winogradskyella sp. 3972H.M.0a.05]|uniref:hypothetical protein n=1 Tax=Winogradskyella sp. 3972H.M.0a.05 TaxID=2950277 RepID=UPI0033935245